MVIKAKKKQIQIDVQYDERLELNHDKKWTAEALFNVLDNAVKYTDIGGNIDIAVCRQELLQKSVSRTPGRGLPRNGRRLFLPGFTVNQKSMTAMALGLGISGKENHHIAERLYGSALRIRSGKYLYDLSSKHGLGKITVL